MSLNTFWKTRRPIKRHEPDRRDSFHAYIVQHWITGPDDEPLPLPIFASYGELKLCENINIRRAPIPTHLVHEVQIREPYLHCEKCVDDINWLKTMNFGTITELR